MGKYMKKSKITGDVAVMEVSQPTSLGVRTRAAKTLALQRLHSASAPPSPSPALAPNPDASSFSYLQLRNRRLEKPPLLGQTKRQHQQQQQQRKKQELEGEVKRSCRGGNTESNQRAKVASANPKSTSIPLSCDGEGYFGKNENMVGANDNYNGEGFCEAVDGNDAGIEVSFGENNLDFEARDRSTRESTPCSFVRDSDSIGTPGSTTRRVGSASTYQRGQYDMQRIIPTAQEMEDFFAYAEQQQQRLFIEKYNFDIENDLPLPGRYEWVQVVP